MICPFCGMPIENALHRALNGIQTNPPIVITNIDYVIEVGNKIATIIEEKHTKRHFGKIYQLITLKRVARALDVPLLVVFVDDLLDEITVYNVPTNRRFPAKRFYNFEKDDPLFIGDYEEFGEFILDNFIYAQTWR
ncbi:hypothetical protein DRP04_07030 [Archaeoglobales archaeon]|nr:MAG: hypothetical protein DRP04_07030 [Archaeoglobales archaeon]